MDRLPFRFFRLRGCWIAACAALAWGGGLGGDAAFGQLRTGRNGSREFYNEARSTKPSRRIGTGIQDDDGVVQAGCRSCVQGHQGEVVPDHAGHADDSEVIVDSDLQTGETGSCGACGGVDGTCGCDGIPHINIRLAFPFARAFENLSVRMEAATFWRDDAAIPALVRTGLATTDADLFGGTVGMDDETQGYRGEVAWRFEKDACTSVQVRFFDAGAQSLTFNSVGQAIPAIERPYLQPPGTPNSIVVRRTAPQVTGEILAHATSDVFGGDILLRQIAYRSPYSKLDLLFGYQTASLTESVFVNSTSDPFNDGINVLTLRDRFDTSNRFHGGVIGFSGIAYAPRWSLSSTVKLGMGTMRRYVGIDGYQDVDGFENVLGGLHARATNEGTYRFNTFVVSPEVNLTLGFRLTRRLEATVGYDYLLLPKVARVADQFDPQLASNVAGTVAGGVRPAFSLRESDFGIHSLNYGLQYRY
jgi:hypothetical protein